MKNTFVLGFVLFSATLVSSAQADDWNLKGLDTVAVEHVETGSLVVSQATMLQLDTDAKLKIKSAGLTLASPDDAKAIFEFSFQDIKGITNEWVVVRLTVREQVQTSSRKSVQKANAITYMDEAFFETSKGAADKKIYDTALNGLVTKFINEYLDQNAK